MMTMTTTMTMITCNLALTPVTCILGFESVVLRINMHARYFHVVFQKEQYLMSKYAYHTFRLSCCVRFSLIGLVMVSHHPLSVKNKVVIRAFNCWYFGNYVLRLFFFLIAVFHLITNRKQQLEKLEVVAVYSLPLQSLVVFSHIQIIV